MNSPDLRGRCLERTRRIRLATFFILLCSTAINEKNHWLHFSIHFRKQKRKSALGTCIMGKFCSSSGLIFNYLWECLAAGLSLLLLPGDWSDGHEASLLIAKIALRNHLQTKERRGKNRISLYTEKKHISYVKSVTTGTKWRNRKLRAWLRGQHWQHGGGEKWTINHLMLRSSTFYLYSAFYNRHCHRAAKWMKKWILPHFLTISCSHCPRC